MTGGARAPSGVIRISLTSTSEGIYAPGSNELHAKHPGAEEKFGNCVDGAEQRARIQKAGHAIRRAQSWCPADAVVHLEPVLEAVRGLG